jgi:CRISPR type IV-associated protein Csf2
MPYFPANDLRGRMRRKAASRIMAEWKKKGQAISEALYLGLTCGASSGNPENDKTVEEVSRANSNVYMGIFGGGTRMLRSGYRVQDLDVISQSNIDAGVVPSALGDATEGGFVPMEYKDGQAQPIREGYKLLHTYNVLRVDDIMRAMRPEELEGIIAGGKEAIARYQADIFGARNTGKAAKAAEKETGVKAEKVARVQVENMQSFKAVAPGTPMYFRLDMNDTLTQSQVGLLILCLKDLIEEGEFGGYVRCGLGKVNVRELKLVVDGEAFAVFENDQDLSLSAKSKELAALAEVEVAALTVAEMELFFNVLKAKGDGQ